MSSINYQSNSPNSDSHTTNYFRQIGPQLRCRICELAGRKTAISRKRPRKCEAHLQNQHSIYTGGRQLKYLPPGLISYAYSPVEVPEEGHCTLLKKTLDKSAVFNYFTKIDQNHAGCNLCEKVGKKVIFSVKHAVYLNLEMHLYSEHNIALKRQGGKKTYSLHKHETKRDRLIIDLICKYRVPMSSIDCNPFFREAIDVSNVFNLKSSAAILLDQFKNHKQLIKQFLESKKANNQKFFLSLSEVLISNRTWLLVCIHLQCGSFICLGVIRVRQKELDQFQWELSQKIYDYGVHFSDIICIIKNGKSTMRVKKCFPSKPQLNCFQKSIQRQLFLAIYNQDSVSEEQLGDGEDVRWEELVEEMILQHRDSNSQFRDKELGRAVAKVRKIVCNLYSWIKAGNHGIKHSSSFFWQHCYLDVGYSWRSLQRMLRSYIERENKSQHYLPTTDMKLLLSSHQKMQIVQLLKILAEVQIYVQSIAGRQPQPIAEHQPTMIVVLQRLGLLIKALQSLPESIYAKRLLLYAQSEQQRLANHEFVYIFNYLLKKQQNSSSSEQRDKLKHIVNRLVLKTNQIYQQQRNMPLADEEIQQFQNYSETGSDDIRVVFEDHGQFQPEILLNDAEIEEELNCYEQSNYAGELLKLSAKRVMNVPVTLSGVYQTFNAVKICLSIQHSKLSSEQTENLLVLSFNIRTRFFYSLSQRK